ncbi:MAG: hypothetical protein ACI93B_001985, partial [Yoonia sp.]
MLYTILPLNPPLNYRLLCYEKDVQSFDRAQFWCVIPALLAVKDRLVRAMLRHAHFYMKGG